MTWDRGAGVLPTTHQFMEAEQYYQLPDGPPYFQLIEGELFMSPSPDFYHQELVTNLASEIRHFLKIYPIGKVAVAPSDVEFNGKNIYQPDVFFIRRERLGIIDRHGAKGPPDLVVEVISSSTGRLDLGPKKANYAKSGVVEFWAIYPREKKVEVFRFQESGSAPVQTLGLTDTLRTELLPGWELSAAELFTT